MGYGLLNFLTFKLIELTLNSKLYTLDFKKADSQLSTLNVQFSILKAASKREQ